jgi:hypothetical protein
MMDLGFRKEDTGELTDQSAKLSQPTNITIKGETPRLEYVELGGFFALIRSRWLLGWVSDSTSRSSFNTCRFTRYGLSFPNEVSSDSSRLLRELSSIPSWALYQG